MIAVALNARKMEQRQRKGDKEDTLSAAAGNRGSFLQSAGWARYLNESVTRTRYRTRISVSRSTR